MQNIIEINHLSKRYSTNQVLDDLCISVKPGSVLGILGNNGAGKTTLLKTLIGLQRADEGEIKIFNDKSPDLSAETKHKIGYVSQESNLIPWMKVAQLIHYTKSFYTVWDEDLVNRLLTDWELDTESTIEKLSLGQKQRLAIILAIAPKPELIILDEPVASLDPSTRRKFIKQLIDLNINEENTIIFSTHITSDLERVAADVLILKDGKNYYHGEIDTLKEQFVKIYLKAKLEKLNPDSIPGLLEIKQIGNHISIVVENINQIDLDSLADVSEEALTFEQLGLEDIFIELHR